MHHQEKRMVKSTEIDWYRNRKENILHMCMALFYRTISELNGETILQEISVADLKKITNILVIDDQEFDYLKDLQKYDFHIRQKYDLTDLSDAAEYDIILCDIRGVGKFLNSKYDGANLIKQLRVKYPNKIIIAYTAEPYEADFESFLDFATGVIAKGSYTIELWVSLLEKYVKELADPVEQWKKTRCLLYDAGVSTLQIAKYESAYVKAVKNREYESLKKLFSKKKDVGAKIMLELVSSVIAKSIKK